MIIQNKKNNRLKRKNTAGSVQVRLEVVGKKKKKNVLEIRVSM